MIDNNRCKVYRSSAEKIIAEAVKGIENTEEIKL